MAEKSLIGMIRDGLLGEQSVQTGGGVEVMPAQQPQMQYPEPDSYAQQAMAQEASQFAMQDNLNKPTLDYELSDFALDENKVKEFGVSTQELNEGLQAFKGVEHGAKVYADIEKDKAEGKDTTQKESFFDQLADGAKKMFGNEEKMLGLALAFNTMRMTPDQGLASHLSSRLKTIRENKSVGQSADSVMKALAADGSPVAKKYAQMVMNNPKMVKEIYSAYIKESGKTTDKFETGSGSYLSSKFNITGLSPDAVYKYNQATGDVTQVNAAEKPQEKYVTGTGSFMKQNYGITGLDDDKTYSINTATNQLSQIAAPDKDPIAALNARASAAGLIPGTQEYQQFMINAGAGKKGMQVKVNADGSVSFTQGGTDSIDMTEGQANTSIFANRMQGANNIIANVEQSGTSVKQFLASGIPLFDNFLTSEKFKMYEQAKSEFINSLLRKESGAAIGRDEFDRYNKQFFPEPGDTQAIIDQKRKNRNVVTEAMFGTIPEAARTQASGNGSNGLPNPEQAMQMLKERYGYSEQDIKKLQQGK